MNSIQILASLTAVVGLVIFIVAIPLMRGRVAPNGIYGFRTKAAFASQSDWYRINAIGGRYLVISGLVILVVGAVGFFLPVSMRDAYSIAAAVVTLLAVFVPCFRLCSLKPCGTSDDKNRDATR